jgi:hypothetical protein
MKRSGSVLVYLVAIILVAGLTVGVMLLLQNINQHKAEATLRKRLSTRLSGARTSPGNMMAICARWIPNGRVLAAAKPFKS